MAKNLGYAISTRCFTSRCWGKLKEQSSMLHEKLSPLLGSEVAVLCKQLADLEASHATENAASTDKFSKLEDTKIRYEPDLRRVKTTLDGDREANNASLRQKFDMEKKNHEDEMHKREEKIQSLLSEVTQQKEHIQTLSSTKSTLKILRSLSEDQSKKYMAVKSLRTTVRCSNFL
ncbi:hypothetical protein Zm00014a_040330 [Zea mays]|uniref:Uncharacterized protein n=1 Tax=Zea mays TaxID=4577 RepID=A0A3L6FZ50_MAIZE|nr:hypothetical protein Zm00014a_040330 [Zea mays]